MDKSKFKTVGQLVLDVLTAVWLVILSFLGTGCVSAGDNSPVTNSTDTNIEFQAPDFDTSGFPAVTGDILSFLL